MDSSGYGETFMILKAGTKMVISKYALNERVNE